MTFRLFLCWLLLMLAWPLSGRAAAVVLDGRLSSLPLADQVDVLEDPEGRLDVHAVAAPAMAAHFLPARVGEGDEINFGYSASVYWLRFTLKGGTADRDWLLEVAFPSLDHLALFTPFGGGFSRQDTGDLLPFTERPVLHRNFVFPLRQAADDTTTYYLRAESKGTLTLPLRLWRPDVFRAHTQATYAALSLYYGTLLALGLYNLLLYAAIRERVYLLYVAFVAGMGVGQLSLNGFGNQFLWPAWPAWGNVAPVVGFNAAGMFGVLFVRSFLDTWNIHWLDRVLLALAAGFALAGIGVNLLPYQPMAVCTSLLGVSFSIMAVAAGIVSLRRGHPGARWFLLAWLVLLLGAAVMGMRNLAWAPTNFFSSYAMQIGSAVEMLLLSFALADRINTMRRDKEAAQAEALLARQREIEHLQDSERELEARVAVRTRALADANQRLLKTEETLRHLAHHDPLTGLPNRMLLDDRLDQAIRKAERRQTVVAVLLVDLDGFKPVNDQYGHAMGDQVLVALSRRFRESVRGSDTVARLGGDEFVIVLDDLQQRADACIIAEKVIDEAARPVEVGNHQLHLGASIGVAFWPEDGHDADALLRSADVAMYVAKNAGRQRFAVSGDDDNGPGPARDHKVG